MPANSSHSFKTVQQLEDILLRERRSRADQKVIDREADTSATDHRPGRLDKLDDTTGLTLSGGGTRSAAFCLGILQSLYEHEVLNCFDYLSTVSGGGYIGSYYTSWMSTLKTRETVLWKPGQKTKSCVHLPPPQSPATARNNDSRPEHSPLSGQKCCSHSHTSVATFQDGC